MDRQLRKDIVEWDIINWSRAIDYWDQKASDIIDSFSRQNKTPKVLELGGRNGGISLYWALKGCNVIWSDIDDSGLEQAKALHSRYGVSDKVSYEIINSLEIPYKEEFDIICLKSVMGAVYGECGGQKAIEQMLSQIKKALKPSGYLFIIENLKGSSIHMFLRKKLRKWGSTWHYFSIPELKDDLASFSGIQSDSFGLIGLFGRGEFLNKLFSSFDRKFDHKVSEKNRYLISLICRSTDK